MVWGCMSAAGVGKLVFINGIMDKTVYLNILKENLLQSANKLSLGGKFCFQQDNDPKHTAHIVRMWLVYHTPGTLKHPPQSPDLNPIEHLWKELENRVRKHVINNLSHLKQLLIQEWDKIPSETTEKLVLSMPLLQSINATVFFTCCVNSFVR